MSLIDTANQQKTKIDELESIRGLAALLVVFFHMPKWNSSFNIEFINNGYLMVDLFFVLSGFVIYNAYSRKMASCRQLFEFQFLRFGRLYPIHLLFLTVFVFIELAKYLAKMKLGISSPNSVPFSDNNFTAFIQHLFLVQSIGPTGNISTFNIPAWSISVEFYTYLIFGLILLFANKYSIYIFSLIFAASIFLLLNQNDFGFENMLHCTTGFFLGCLTAYLKVFFNIRLRPFFSFISFSSLVIFLAINSRREYGIFIYLITAILIFCLASSEHGFLNRILNFRVLTWLGTISYSVYMSHAAIIWLANNFIRVILKKPELIDSDGKSTPMLSLLETVIAHAFIIIAVLFISHLTYRLIERPLREKSRRFIFSSDHSK